MPPMWNPSPPAWYGEAFHTCQCLLRCPPALHGAAIWLCTILRPQRCMAKLSTPANVCSVAPNASWCDALIFDNPSPPTLRQCLPRRPQCFLARRFGFSHCNVRFSPKRENKNALRKYCYNFATRTSGRSNVGIITVNTQRSIYLASSSSQLLEICLK